MRSINVKGELPSPEHPAYDLTIQIWTLFPQQRIS